MEGSIVLRPADGQIEILLGCIGIEPSAATGSLRGGWWFTFGADARQPLAAARAHACSTDGVIALRIEGLAHAALRSITVQHGGATLFEMGTHVGMTGHVSTAGEILHAMGQYRGGCTEGLLVDLAPTAGACGWRALRVRLHVQASDRPCDPPSKRAGLAARVSLVAGGRAAARSGSHR